MLQVLRSIDKFDRIGRAGVVELLQKPASEFGADLDPVRAEFIGMMLDTRADTNEGTLAALTDLMGRAALVNSRLKLMALMENSVLPDGSTVWDRLIGMPVNADNSWSDDARPENIGWALDDILDALRRVA